MSADGAVAVFLKTRQRSGAATAGIKEIFHLMKNLKIEA
jgi:hypothetical protein